MEIIITTECGKGEPLDLESRFRAEELCCRNPEEVIPGAFWSDGTEECWGMLVVSRFALDPTVGPFIESLMGIVSYDVREALFRALLQAYLQGRMDERLPSKE